MDSDSDLQAYINELSRKTHDLQYGDHQSASVDESEPSHSSFVEISEKRNGYDTDVGNKKQSAKTNKVKELEEKYLRRTPKLTEQSFSLSFSDYNLELEEDKLNTDNILTFPDEVTLDSSKKTKAFGNQDKKVITETGKVYNNLNSAEGKGNTEQDIRNLKSQRSEEEKIGDSSLLSTKNGERKLSDNSSLLNKGSIFYPTNNKAGKQKSPGKIIFRMRSSTLSDSDTIKSEVTSSVSEEIPELMQNENAIKVTKQTHVSKEGKDERDYYDENTFENSESSSSIKNESTSSNTSGLVSCKKSDSKSATETSVSEQASSEVEEDVDDTSETIQSVKKHSSTSVEESSKSDSDVSEKSESNNSTEDSSESQIILLKSHTNSSSANESSDPDKVNSSSSQNNISKSSEKHISKNKTDYQIHKKEKEHKMEKKEKAATNTKLKKKFSTSLSSSVTSTPSSSSSSSFYVKMKNKKYREKKRKIKQEKELTELIMKLLIKNLPIILQQSLGLHSNAEILHHQPPRAFVCHQCGGNSVALEMTQRRIDDALRQTVDLTRQFLESHQTLIESQYSHRNSSYKYTTLRNYST